MSIYIDNFFMEVGDTATCTSLVDFSADVLETGATTVSGTTASGTTTSGTTASGTYITTSGTYFTYNGVQVPTTFTTISGGYHVSYQTVPSGNIILGLRVQNTKNESIFKEYEFHYGYEVNWNKVTYWGPDKEVAVFVMAENDTIAPGVMYYSTFFRTHKLYVANLPSDITSDGSGGRNLGSTITPQSKYLEYGRTYTITVSGVRDFSGNELEPIVYSFTIEDEN